MVVPGIFYCICKTCNYILKDSCINTNNFKIGTLVDNPHKKQNIANDECRGKLTIFALTDRNDSIVKLLNHLIVDDQT